MDLSHLSDSQLYRKCKKYGLNARLWIRKFEGLLPEVYLRRLYKRRGYVSIHEFGAKLAGMSHDKVDRILHLADHLKDKPHLKKLLVEGRIGYSKLTRVAHISTPQTEKDWAEKVQVLTKSALEVYVKEQRKISNGNISRLETVPGHEIQSDTLNSTASNAQYKTLSFKVTPEVEFQLKQFQQRLEKERGQKLSLGEVLSLLLQEKNEKRPVKKIVVNVCPECTNKKVSAEKVTRYIPRNVQRLIYARQGGKCAFPNCHCVPEIFHHTRRFSLVPNHDPTHIVHLCKAHERLAHAGFIFNEEAPPNQWRITEDIMQDVLKFSVDSEVYDHRREPLLQFSDA